MTLDIALVLIIDGLASGAVYLLAGLGLVLIFSVTRVVFVPFGDIAAFAALTLASFQRGSTPGSIWLLATLAALACTAECVRNLRDGAPRRLVRTLLLYGALPLLPALAGYVIAGQDVHELVRIAVTLAIALPIGALLDRLALRPVADASALILLIIALALHFLFSAVGLMAFGPEGVRTKPLIDGVVTLPGNLVVPAQLVLIIVCAAALSLLFYAFFGRSITGKALRATAVNRTGARLVGIRPDKAAVMAHLIGSGLAGVVGILIAPVTTIYYDSGFMIGLKAFVGAIIGGLSSYPVTAIGSIFVGLIESFASFLVSAYKEIIVFSLIIPVLIVRSVMLHRGDEEDVEELG